jgi:hypothetical protein
LAKAAGDLPPLPLVLGASVLHLDREERKSKIKREEGRKSSRIIGNSKGGVEGVKSSLHSPLLIL